MESCAICHSMLSDLPSLVTPCGHLFHQVCLERWLNGPEHGAQPNNSCPICRAFVVRQFCRDYRAIGLVGMDLSFGERRRRVTDRIKGMLNEGRGIAIAETFRDLMWGHLTREYQMELIGKLDFGVALEGLMTTATPYTIYQLILANDDRVLERVIGDHLQLIGSGNIQLDKDFRESLLTKISGITNEKFIAWPMTLLSPMELGTLIRATDRNEGNAELIRLLVALVLCNRMNVLMSNLTQSQMKLMILIEIIELLRNAAPGVMEGLFAGRLDVCRQVFTTLSSTASAAGMADSVVWREYYDRSHVLGIYPNISVSCTVIRNNYPMVEQLIWLLSTNDELQRLVKIFVRLGNLNGYAGLVKWILRQYPDPLLRMHDAGAVVRETVHLNISELEDRKVWMRLMCNPHLDAPLLAHRVHPSLIQWMIRFGVNVRKTTFEGNNVLHQSAIYLNPAQFHGLTSWMIRNSDWRVLLEQNGNGNTPLHLALLHMDVKASTIRLFKSHGVDMTLKNEAGQGFMHYAVAGERRTQLLDALFKAGVPPCSPDNRGFTPLHLAAKMGNLDAVKWVGQKGRRYTGKALIWALNRGGNRINDVVRLLVTQLGAPTNQLDEAGKNAMWYALHGKCKDVLEPSVIELLTPRRRRPRIAPESPRRQEA